jgi:hypothetical protein
MSEYVAYSKGQFDSHNAFDSSTRMYTIVQNGRYKVYQIHHEVPDEKDYVADYVAGDRIADPIGVIRVGPRDVDLAHENATTAQAIKDIDKAIGSYMTESKQRLWGMACKVYPQATAEIRQAWVDGCMAMEQNMSHENGVTSVNGVSPKTIDLTLSAKVDLIKTKVEILKMKADDYSWQCHVSEDVKAEFEKILVEIDNVLEGT